MDYFFTVFNRGFNEAINKDAVDKQLQAALTSERSFSYFREGNRERFDFSKMDYDGLIKCGYLIAGTPDSVAEQIQDQMKQVGADHFMGMFHIGNLKHDKVIIRSICSPKRSCRGCTSTAVPGLRVAVYAFGFQWNDR